MSTTYLFRIDGAADNDAYFAALQPTVAQVYAGVELKVGAAGWIPDLVKVEIKQEGDECSLTIVELEASRSVALVSCRKYLPENSTEIASAFLDYLDRVIRQCKAYADPRAVEFQKLRSALSKSENIRIATAGALRSSKDYVEHLALMDQPQKFALTDHSAPSKNNKELPNLRGSVILSANEVNALTRCILVLDSVVRKFDHSSATMRAWRGGRSQPLLVLLKKSESQFPMLNGLLLTRGKAGGMGMEINFDTVISEVARIWVGRPGVPISQDKLCQMIEGFYPVAAEITKEDAMPAIFAKARSYLATYLG